MSDAADAGVHPRAADRFGIYDLAGSSFDEVRTSEAHKTRAFDHDDRVAERGEIGAACNASPHHSGDLRHTELAPHKGIIVKNPAAAILAGEYPVLVRQIHARGIDQVDDGHAVAHGDFLRTQSFGDSFGPPGARFHGGIAGDDHGVTALDDTDAGDGPEAGRFAIVLVVGQQESDFEERRPGVDQGSDTFPRSHLSGAVLAFDLGGTAAGA